MMIRLFFVTLLVGCLFLTKAGSREYFSASYAHIYSDCFFQDGEPGKKKNNLLKKLTGIFKFRKRANARVMKLIDSTGLKKTLDSLLITMSGQDSLTQATDASVKELKTTITELRNAINQLLQSKAGTDPGSANANGDGNSDKEIESLVNEVMPLLAEDPQQQKQKREKLLTLRNIMFRPPGDIDTLAINDSLRKTYTVKLRSNRDIIGFYDYHSANTVKTPDLRLITTLSWYALTFDGQTGIINGLNDWDKSAIIDEAQQKGCKITLTILDRDRKNIAVFLDNRQAQVNLTRSILQMLMLRRANGVNIYFQDLPATSGSRFVEFIVTLSQALKKEHPDYVLNIILPAYDKNKAYQLSPLNNYVNYFLIDFTQISSKIPGPIAPLAGTFNNDLETCISRYLNTDILPAKFIPYLPYYGAMWKFNTKGATFLNYVSYTEIRSRYQLPVQYDKASTSAYIDLTATNAAVSETPNSATDITGQIWFDDDKTLSLKYDYILQNGLGGIAIQALGYDGDYGELRDILTEKFVSADTMYIASIVTKPKKLLTGWQWNMAYLTAKYEQYHFLFTYPCETSFPKILVHRWEKKGVKNNNRSDIKKELTFLFGIISIALLIFSLTVLYIFIYQGRRLAKWKWKKFIAALLILLSVMLTVSTFMYMFLNNNIAGFGTSESPQDCFDFSLGTILTFIFTGILIGIIITRFLVFPLIKKEDIP